MLSQEEIINLKELLKSGVKENAEIAAMIAIQNNVNIYQNYFVEIWDFINEYTPFETNELTNENPTVKKIVDIISIESLDMTFSDDIIVPASICLLLNCSELSICALKQIRLPISITYLDKLKVLRLSLQGQKEIPKIVYDLTTIVELDLSRSYIEEISRDIWKLRNLEILNLNMCYNFKWLPNELFGMKNLKEVYLLNTKVDEISTSIIHSSIEVFATTISEFSKKNILNRSYMQKLITAKIHQDTLLYDCKSKYYLEKTEVNNVPSNIRNRGLNAVKEYLKNSLGR